MLTFSVSASHQRQHPINPNSDCSPFALFKSPPSPSFCTADITFVSIPLCIHLFCLLPPQLPFILNLFRSHPSFACPTPFVSSSHFSAPSLVLCFVPASLVTMSVSG